MCGVAGILDLKGTRSPNPAELRRMIEALHHRGPDGFGFHLDGPIGLAHARLSIIDLAGGWQPIHNEDRSVFVVFNGEIFNYIELRRDLELQGHRFYTQSDTEVIVHLYEQHGLDFLQYLNGQFALALWDARRARLVLARDRVGIRPLFYTEAAGRIAFASEVKALFALPEMPRALNAQALGELFTYWSPLAPHSVFEGISVLPPGHMLTFERGRRELRCYWDWSFPPREHVDSRSIEECLEGLRERLVRAVRLQVRADVPVGAYLSGGLDSSLIAALLKRYTDVPLRTFSIRFADDAFDESTYQREMVRHLGTEHTELLCRASDIARAFPQTVWHAESPLLRTAPTPLMLLAGHVREAGYKVVLTGEGADEVMAGYDIFKEGKIRRFWAHDVRSQVRPRLFARLYGYLENSPTAAAAYAQRFFGQGMEHAQRPYFAHIPRWLTTRRTWQFFSPALAAQLQEWDPLRAIDAQLPVSIGHWRGLSQDQYIEAHTLLSGYLLCSQGDRMAMAHSIEGRFPFLDHDVIEYCNALPTRMKLHGLTEKFLLKRLAADLLPATIHQRVKQPYRAPDAKSFFDNGVPVEYVGDLFSESRIRAAGYFDPNLTRRLLQKCRDGRAIGFSDNMAFMGILSTMLVDSLFVRGESLPHAEAVVDLAAQAQAV